MDKARINGIEISYRDEGEGSPLFLIHGFTGNLANWVFQYPILTPHYRVISIDLRGHGHSEKPTASEDYSLDIMAEDAYGLLQHLNVESCYVIGHSMGGMVAQRLALAHPDSVGALVLVGTAAEVPDGVRTEDGARLLELARTDGMGAVFDEHLRLNAGTYGLSSQPLLTNVLRQQFLLTSADAYVHCARNMIDEEPLLERLSTVQAPTLIACGEKDDRFLGPSKRMHERIAGSELEILAGAGHTPQVEKAGEFNRILTGFLSRVQQGVRPAGD